MPAANSATLVQRLRARAAAAPSATLYTFLQGGETEAGSLTAGQLDLRARAVAAALAEHVETGDRVVIAYPSGLDFIVAYFGALYAGAIPVPAETPATSWYDTNETLAKIVTDCRPAAIASDEAGLDAWEKHYNSIPRFSECVLLDVSEVDDSGAGSWKEPAISADSVAALLYSCYSGPARGLPLTHNHLAFLAETTKSAFGLKEKLVFAGFLNLNFDFGFQTQVALPLFYDDGRVVFMSSGAFAEPTRWLKAISKYRANASAASIDAIARCARALNAADVKGLDLSAWQAAVVTNAYYHQGELDAFARLLAPAGFRAEALRPVYATAEATAIITATPPGTRPQNFDVDQKALFAGQIKAGSGAAATKLVSQGAPVRDTVIKIADPTTGAVLGDDTIGEIWVNGPGVVGRFWTDAEASAKQFAAQVSPSDGKKYLRTGDFGFLHQGQLYALEHWARHVVVGGRTITDEDIEAAARHSHPALQHCPAAAFFLNYQGKMRGFLVIEVPTNAAPDQLQDLSRNVQSRLRQEVDYEPEQVYFVKPGIIPSNDQGQPERYLCRRKFMGLCVAP